jgi:succinate dehydrogenase / fumarate reductase, membrane anchor subunit
MAIKARSFKDARSQAKSNPELVWWVFMRLSGAFLVLLTFFHLFNNYIVISELDWTYDAVLYSYTSITEKLYLLALLTLGLAHGTNGLRYVIDDTTSRSPQARFWIKLLAYTVIAAILVFGILALLIPPVPKP